MARIDNILLAFPWTYKFGRGIVGTSFTTLWQDNGASTSSIFDGFLDDVAIGTEETVTVVSDDANDTAVGTGARSVQIIGQNAQGIEISEIIVMNGLTPVSSVNSYQCIYRASVLTDGNGLFTGATAINLGIITVTSSVSAKKMTVIDAHKGKTLQGFYRVPMNKYGKLLCLRLLPTGNKAVQIEAYFRFPLDSDTWARGNGEVRSAMSAWQINGSGDFDGTVTDKIFCRPQLMFPGVDIMIIGKTDVGTAEVTVDFEVEPVDYTL